MASSFAEAKTWKSTAQLARNRNDIVANFVVAGFREVLSMGSPNSELVSRLAR